MTGTSKMDCNMLGNIPLLFFALDMFADVKI